MDILFDIIAVASLTFSVALARILWLHSQNVDDRFEMLSEGKAGRELTSGVLSHHMDSIKALGDKFEALEDHLNVRFVTKPEQQLYEKKEENDE